MFTNRQTQSTIFRSESSLSPRYTPTVTTGREKETERIADALYPITRGKAPDNLLVYGPSGAGKSTIVSYTLDKLEQETNVKTVSINCWQYNTRSSLLSQLLIELGFATPRKGKPVDELLLRLQEWLDKNRSVCVVLDEFDQHRDQTEIVYDLQHCNEETDHPLGLILVSNKPPEDIELDPRSASRLNCRPVPFRPYGQQELYEILKRRAEKAFKPGVVSDDALELIAQRVAERGGDCRHAIELLHRAGRIADRESNTAVTTVHVEQSFNPARD